MKIKSPYMKAAISNSHAYAKQEDQPKGPRDPNKTLLVLAENTDHEGI
jgi:hypothetical protein